jgi:hypothetical protein
MALGPLTDPEMMCTNTFPTFIQAPFAGRKMKCRFCGKQQLAFSLINVIKGPPQLGVGV